MFEEEFNQKKENLLKKLPDYLRAKGINIESSFKCLNPKDASKIPCMKYDPRDNTVKCFNCNADYNIFDLIGLDYNLTSFAHQFIKAHELYIGKVPIGFIEILKNLESETTPKEETSFQPLFEIAHDDNEGIRPQFGFADAPSENIEMPKAGFEKSASFNEISPFDEARLRPFPHAQGAASNNTIVSNISGQSAFGTASAGASLSQFGQSLNPSTRDANQVQRKFGDQFSSPFQVQNTDTIYDYTEYIEKCAQAVSLTDYFKNRGLSESVIRRFKLGYDESYEAELDKITGVQKIWKAAVIPYGTHGFCIRNTDLNANNSNERYKKKGSIDIFNHEVLEMKGDIFIAEGEFDALSLETLGHRALGLGGAGNVRPLIELIKNCGQEHFFYICLDNDSAGSEATNKIANALYDLHYQFKIVNLAHPYKDINEALYTAPEVLKSRLNNLNSILEFHFDTVNPETTPLKYVSGDMDMNLGTLSKCLYSVSGSPQVLRRFEKEIVALSSNSILYASSSSQCRYFSNIISSGNEIGYKSINIEQIRLLDLDESNIFKNLKEGIDSLILRGISNFSLILDLCPFDKKSVESCLKQLSSQGNDLNITVLALCKASDTELAEAYSLQNISLCLNSNGDYKCETLDSNGVPCEFIVSNGI
ncbi:MAG: toprim domain-containing protein [Succinivibrio sp.]